MFVKQLSVFMENRSGRLASACRALAQKDINILALSLADTADFGILRLILADAEAGRRVLEDAGFTVDVTNVLAVQVEDRPGGLGSILDALEADGIDVDYMYAFASQQTSRAVLLFRFADNEAAIKSLTEAGFCVMSKVDLLGGE